MNIVLVLVTIAGLLSGLAILAALVRRRPFTTHQIKTCPACMTGFLCEAAMQEAPARRR